jgi:ABC-type uncharacterized transport system substrate-binding protein
MFFLLDFCWSYDDTDFPGQKARSVDMKSAVRFRSPLSTSPAGISSPTLTATLTTMGNVGNPIIVLELSELQAAARTLGLEVDTLEVRRPQDIARALEAVKGRAHALYVCQDAALTLGNRLRINTLALGARLPVMHSSRELIEGAGLMSYGPNFLDLYRRAGDYVDKILRRGQACRHPGRAANPF